MVKKTTMLVVAAIVTATALVIGISSFNKKTTLAPTEDMLTFQYSPPSIDPFTPSNVADVSNWSYTTDATQCSNQNVRPCKIYVPNNPSYIGPGNTLKSAINITTAGTSSDAYVDHTAAGSGTQFVSNKLQ